MPKFHVDFATSAGDALERLTVEATDELDAARKIFNRDGIPVAIRPAWVGILGFLQNSVGGGARVDADALSLFAEQLAELLNAGLTLEQGLQLLGSQDTATKNARLAERLLGRVRAGESLSGSLSHEEGIPLAFTGIIQGAERSGSLGEGFRALSQFLERQRDISRRIKAALTYPAVVLLVTMFSALFILIVVIPEFTPLFAGEEQRLPVVTQVVLFCSDVLVNRLSVMSLGIAALGFAGYICYSRIEVVRTWVRQTLMRLPPVQYAIRLELVRAIHVFGVLLSSGVEASEALGLAAAVPSNTAIRDQFSDGARRLREGASVVSALAEVSFLPKSVATLIAVGERSGDLGRAVTRSSQVLETDTNRRIDRFLAMLNPVAVISLGGIVAVLIASVMLGILSINQMALR